MKIVPNQVSNKFDIFALRVNLKQFGQNLTNMGWFIFWVQNQPDFAYSGLGSIKMVPNQVLSKFDGQFDFYVSGQF